ncbi:hypothetical protein K466DRAFT_326880 [Polyporus arcularius HHB13444]|uniref:Uncharacterized protein n=1 Tax=Polyporus arcularius HHB13444 TaxID=1314778 RepID=A0A5C3PPQ1_9APHY|nr:hypothetical protein K466DRAFT_326880 [Polyporus arcularius HHB13444]
MHGTTCHPQLGLRACTGYVVAVWSSAEAIPRQTIRPFQAASPQKVVLRVRPGSDHLPCCSSSMSQLAPSVLDGLYDYPECTLSPGSL